MATAKAAVLNVAYFIKPINPSPNNSAKKNMSVSIKRFANFSPAMESSIDFSFSLSSV